MTRSEHPTFEEQIKLALRYYHEPQRLAADSRLATAYFLSGAVLRSQEPLAWEELLRRELLAAADDLWGPEAPASREELEASWDEILQQPDDSRYSYLVLELRYFQRFVRPRATRQIWEEYLRQSRAEFYRDLKRATAALGDALLVRLRPTVRLDAPPDATSMVGRTRALGTGLAALRQQRRLGLSGVSGTGKTTLGAAIAAGWEEGPVFWFTVRPDLSDGFNHLLHALAHFCHRHGASRLWRVLAANQGRIDNLGLTRSLVRADLESLGHPLLCFDEVDVWQEATHPVWQLLTDLQEESALLLIGQRIHVPVSAHQTVAGLDIDETRALLRGNDIELSAEESQRLQQRTGGNPRLLWLSAALLQRGESLEQLLREGAPFHLYLTHLWERLSTAERQLLEALSIFEVPAPADAWEPDLLHELQTRHLLFNDGRGGVFLLPSLARAVVEEIGVEKRERLHAHAARLFSERGEATLAAYHLQQAGQPETAIHVWFPQQAGEIRRGQADLARRIFSGLSLNALPSRERKALRLIRAALAELEGDARAGLDALAEEAWPPDQALSLHAQRLRGAFLEALGETHGALQAYNAGIATAASLMRSVADLRVQRGRLHVRQRDLADARREARLARYAVEQLNGLVQEAAGDLTEAEVHYRTALSLAQALDHESGLAETNRSLSNIYGLRRELDRALEHANAASTFYEQIGDHVSAARVHSNLTASYLDAGRYDEVIRVGLPALEFFRRVQHTHGTAATAANLAEASLELGNLEQAHFYAELSLAQEEPLAVPYALYTLGLVAKAEEDLAAAEAHWLRCYQTAAENDDLFIQAHAQLLLARLYRQTERTDEAREEAKAAARAFDHLGLDDMAAQAHELEDG